MLTRCPHCFLELPRDHFAYRCTNPSCPEQTDVQLSSYQGVEVPGRAVTDVRGATAPGRVGCTSCSVPTEQEVCPECHYGLLPGWRQCSTTCMAMAGARESGKSIYIAVLIKQAQLWCEQGRRAMVAADSRTEEHYKLVYERPLYEARGFLPPTPSASTPLAGHREPLIFDLGTFHDKHHMLVLRDVAGEDLERPPSTGIPFRFFSRADVVTFLFDPLHLEEIQGQLEGITLPRVRDATDPLLVLRNLIRFMRGGAAFGELLATPLALVLAKFDALTELAEVEEAPLADAMRNAGATFNLDPSMDGSFDLADAARLQAEVESLLVRLQARTLLNLVDDAFRERQLFAVSALGAVPTESEQISELGIAPFRVLDPLKWTLARSGVIAYG